MMSEEIMCAICGNLCRDLEVHIYLVHPLRERRTTDRLIELEDRIKHFKLKLSANQNYLTGGLVEDSPFHRKIEERNATELRLAIDARSEYLNSIGWIAEVGAMIPDDFKLAPKETGR